MTVRAESKPNALSINTGFDSIRIEHGVPVVRKNPAVRSLAAVRRIQLHDHRCQRVFMMQSSERGFGLGARLSETLEGA